jgi:hypothetical protein
VNIRAIEPSREQSFKTCNICDTTTFTTTASRSLQIRIKYLFYRMTKHSRPMLKKNTEPKKVRRVVESSPQLQGENGLLLLNWWVALVPDVTDAHEPDSRQDRNSSELSCLQTASLTRLFHNPITLQTRSLESRPQLVVVVSRVVSLGLGFRV